ncbi:SDR family oxidoreductase [Saccharothrix sp. MB29]|nr:SDR family oxidoreductase [Saccharothrix sp. MB29]
MDVAVVTGAARGFGFEIARRLRGRGYEVVLADVDEAVVGVAAAIGGHGVVADVRDPAAHRAVAGVAAGVGRLSLWVNNAGVLVTGDAWEHGDEAVRRLVEVNLLGVVHGSLTAVEAMRTGGGTVLNVASTSAYGPVPGLALYAATKAGVLSFGVGLQGTCGAPGCRSGADVLPGRGRHRDGARGPVGPRFGDPVRERVAAVGVAGGGRGGVDAGRRRLVRAVPAYRAGMARAGAVLPSVGLRCWR